MFKKLKLRLVLLYGITTSIILTVIIIGIAILNYKQNSQQEKILFLANAEQIVEKIRTENIINSSWMLQKQLENQYIILVEENGKRLASRYQIQTGTDTEQLAAAIKESAAREGVVLDRRPLYARVEKTAVLSLDFKAQGSYLGMGVNIPTRKGWQTIMVFSENRLRSGAGQILFFAAIDLAGVAALFLISSLYIGKVIRPLEEGQENQNAFIAAASHELKSPLTVIKTGISAIREDVTRADQFLGHVETECDRMTRLIQDMLLLAAADAKRWELKPEPLDLDTLLIECYDMICSCLNEKQMEISLELPEEALSSMNGDKERIRQIITILADNAMSHTPAEGRIVIRAYQQKRCVILEVEDHGKGIPEEEKKRVFERFYRGDQSRTDKKHFGLGLSIARELAELHHGEILIRDTPGGGATFAVKLPI